MKDLGSDIPFVREVETALARTIDGGAVGALLPETARHLVLAPDAKRMRPLFVREVGRAWEVEPAALVDLAVSAELVHSASLLHDDVVDDGRVRRGRPTANAKFGNSAAVLAGDWLLTEALGRLDGLPREVSRRALAVVAEMSAAAMGEVLARGRLDGGLATWRRLAMGKTGALFGWCGWSAAYVAGADEAATALDRYGRHLGVAFQLADDLNDLMGDEPGKDRFSDLREGAPSYPVLVAATRSASFAERLQAAWRLGERPPELVQSLGLAALSTGAGVATEEALRRELTAARDALGPAALDSWASGLDALTNAFRARLKQRAA